jgi:hypothetical protein
VFHTKDSAQQPREKNSKQVCVRRRPTIASGHKIENAGAGWRANRNLEISPRRRRDEGYLLNRMNEWSIRGKTCIAGVLVPTNLLLLIN